MRVRANGIDRPLNGAAFAAWASVYDTQLNPLLALEERYLNCILPSIDDKDILDAGCGTGRWLRKIAGLGSPKSRHGIDSSPEMLATARQSCERTISFVLAQLPIIPLLSASIDLALCSFTLGYVSDIDALARQLRRVLRDDGDLLITDIHPDTALALGWQRSFRLSETTFHLQFEHHSIETISHVFAQHDFEVVGLYQPSFGDPEHTIFTKCGKEASYVDASGRPAIYILHLRPQSTLPYQSSVTLANAQFVLGSQELDVGDITISDGRIASIISAPAQHAAHTNLDLSGYTLFPGLINAHDHLEFGLFPRLGSPPYANAKEWALDIHNDSHSLIEKHTSVPRDVRLWWGAMRNLLCGVTTVCHHNPIYPVFKDPQFPLRVVTDFDWAHSLSFSNDLDNMHNRSNSSRPFIIHAGEGIDADSHNEFARLLALKLLDARTILVHGLAMDLDEASTLNQHGASLISCPSSNFFLFGHPPAVDLLTTVDRLAIGSDSPLTADGDLLDEIRFCYKNLKLCPNSLCNLVTKAPAAMLSLPNGIGQIAHAAPADLFAVRSTAFSPAQQLVSLSWHDVELVMIEGKIRLASDEMMQRLPPELHTGLSQLSVEGINRWIAAPIKSLFESAARVLGDDGVALNGRHISIPETHHVT